MFIRPNRKHMIFVVNFLRGYGCPWAHSMVEVPLRPSDMIYQDMIDDFKIW